MTDDARADEALERWIGGERFRRWFADHVEHASGHDLRLVAVHRGVNVHCAVTDGTRTWLVRWRRLKVFHQKLELRTEYRLLDAVHRSGIPAPRPFAYCTDADVATKPFYVMEKLDGVTAEAPERVEGRSDDDRRHRSGQVADVLVALRSLDLDALGLAEVLPPARDAGIGELAASHEDLGASGCPELDEAVTRLRKVDRPGNGARSLLHGDFHPFNVVLEARPPSGIVGIIDWEAGRRGEPTQDLGRFLLHCDDAIGALAGYRPPGSPPGGFYDREAILERYLDGSGDDLDRVRYHEAVEAVRSAVFAERACVQLRAQDPDDERLETLDAAVHLIARHALELAP